MEKKYKDSKLALFLKKNIYVILMAVLLLAIVGLVAYTVITATKPADVPVGVVDANGDPVDNNANPDDKSNTDVQLPSTDDKPNPDNGQSDAAPTVEFVIALPIADAEVQKDYTDTTLVYNATMKHWATHQGIDYKAEVGTAVRAVFDGEVSEIVTTTMRGTEITLRHSDGFTTTYALLGPNVTVKVGDKVSRGDVLGYVAQTGYFESADGPHLHFETRRNGDLVNPNYYFSTTDNK